MDSAATEAGHILAAAEGIQQLDKKQGRLRTARPNRRDCDLVRRPAHRVRGCPPGSRQELHSTDIIRRIIKDYFGFHVKFVMNTTDLDDKIIVSARQQYLLDRFKQEQDSPDEPISEDVLATTRAAFQQYITKNLPFLPASTPPEDLASMAAKVRPLAPVTLPASDPVTAQNQEPTVTTVSELLLQAHQRIAHASAAAICSPGTRSEFFARVDEIMRPYLDYLHGASKDSDNHEIYLALTQKFEPLL